MLNENKKVLLNAKKDNDKLIYCNKFSIIKQNFIPSPTDTKRRRFFPKMVIYSLKVD